MSATGAPLRRPRTYVDVSRLPTLGLGSNGILWWGTLGFVLIEGFTLALCVATLLYLRRNFSDWPPLRTPFPSLIAPSIQIVVMLLSLIPLVLADRAARRQDLGATRLWMTIVTLFGIAMLVIRWFEITSLNTRWDSHAYGSAVWAILIAHTLLLVPDAMEKLTLTVILLVKPREKYYSAVTDNSVYWPFVCLVWLPLSGLVYYLPWIVGR